MKSHPLGRDNDTTILGYMKATFPYRQNEFKTLKDSSDIILEYPRKKDF